MNSAATQSFPSLFRHPSAFLPLAMSLTALAVMFVGPRVFGDLHAADEGPTAHIWQVLMAGQLPLITFFVFKWLRRSPAPTLKVLSLQAGAVLANFATVFLLGVG